jgi:DNA adenine methylase
LRAAGESHVWAKANMTDKEAERKERTKPFLRWAGGKTKFVQEILSRLPVLPPGATYYEPFLGAGAVFLAYAPQRAVLSDLNPDLVHTFTAVRNHPAEVVRRLYALHYRDTEDSYYRIREQFNRGGSACMQAARFIFLNQTSFNGIYRVNRQGQYNVPYGFKTDPNIPGKRDLESASVILKNAVIKLADYKQAVTNAAAGDVVYLDPPYPPLNGTSYFTHYTKERFASEDQIEVANTARKLCDRGCTVIVTNADTPLIRRLYAEWSVSEITRPRWVTTSRHKHRVVELIFTSY